MASQGEIQIMSFENFKEKIISKTLNSEQIFQKYFIDKETFFFKEIETEDDLEYKLKKDFSFLLDVHINDIYVVGSGKTGFSMNPKQYGQGFDEEFKRTHILRNKSDLDVAIVSPHLYETIQETMYDWSIGYKKSWDRNSFYLSGTERFGVELKYKFLEYLGRGWYRPDLAPANFKIETKNGKLDEVTSYWRQKLRRKISYAVYKNWKFFKKYQLENIDKVIGKISSGDFL